MCLGDVLHACFSPIVACSKYLCSAMGLALVFSAGKAGIDLKADWPIILIVLACILALLWFCMTEFENRQGDNIQEEDMVKEFEQICETQTILRDYEVRHNYCGDLVDSCNQISNNIMAILLQGVGHIFALLVLFIMMTVWFLPADTHLGFIAGLFLGALAMLLISWGVFTFAGKSMAKTILEGIHFKQQIYDFMYMCGFGLIMLSIAVIYFLFLFAYFLFKGIAEIGAETSQEELQTLGVCCCGYALGVVIAGFVYREITSVFARSVFNSIDGLIKCDSNLSFNNPYVSQPTKVLYVIQNILATQVVNLLDSAMCMSVLTVCAFVMFANSAEVAKEDVTWKTLLAPTIYVSVNCFCVVVIQMFKSSMWRNEVVQFVKINIRVQVLIANAVTLAIFAFMPMVTILGDFTMKGIDSSAALAKEGITMKHISYCCIMGQMTNLLLLSLLEWITSHGCAPVRNMASSSSDRVQTQNHNYSTYLSMATQVLIVLTIGILIAACHSLCGYAGLLAASAGFLINVMIIVPIFFIGAMSADAHKLCQAAHVVEIIKDRIFKITWAARNYMIYLRITNAGGASLLGVSFMGCALYLIKDETNPQNDFMGIFGILFGVGLAYMIKGLTVGAIISISKKFDLNIYESGIAAEIAKNHNQFLSGYVNDKIWLATIWVYVLFFLDTLFVLLFGYFFGKRGTPGFLLGHCIICIFLMFSSIIEGTTLKNARYYNEVDDRTSKRSRIYQSYVHGDMIGTVVEESTAVPLLIYLLYNTMLVTALTPLFGGEGDLFTTSAPAPPPPAG